MENLRSNYQGYNYLLNSLHNQVLLLKKNQQHLITEQERVYYKSLNNEEMIIEILKNQAEMSNNINKIIELLGDE